MSLSNIRVASSYVKQRRSTSCLKPKLTLPNSKSSLQISALKMSELLVKASTPNRLKTELICILPATRVQSRLYLESTKICLQLKKNSTLTRIPRQVSFKKLRARNFNTKLPRQYKKNKTEYERVCTANIQNNESLKGWQD